MDLNHDLRSIKWIRFIKDNMDHGSSEHVVNGEQLNIYLGHCYMSLSDGQSVT